MNPAQSVIFTTILSFTIFGFAGTDALARAKNGINRLTGQPVTDHPTDSGPVFTPQVVTGWAVLFIILIAMADIPASSELAVGFGWLILLSVALAFGPDAFDNISRLLGQNPATVSEAVPADQGGGGGIPPKVL